MQVPWNVPHLGLLQGYTQQYISSTSNQDENCRLLLLTNVEYTFWFLIWKISHIVSGRVVC